MSEYAETTADRCQNMAEEQDAEHFMTYTMMIKKLKWLHRGLVCKIKRFQFPQHQINDNCKIKNENRYL